MRGMVLAAGFGTRLGEITEMIPKALVPIFGVPLVEIATRYFRKNAIETIAVNSHYHSDIMRMFIESLPYHVTFFEENPDILGTGGAIYNAREFLKVESSFAIINADIVTTTPLRKLAVEFEKSSAICALICSNRGERATIAHTEGGYCGPIGATFRESNELTAFTGLALYKKEALEYFTADDFSVVPVWQRMAEAGCSVEVWNEAGYWADTGTPSEIGRVHWDILDRRIPFDFPLGVTADYDRKLAYASSVDPKAISADSSYLWVGDLCSSGEISADHSILSSGIALQPDRHYSQQIIFPWCEVSLEQ